MSTNRLKKLPVWLKRLLLVAGLSLALVIVGTLALVVIGLRDRPGRADVALVLGSKVELNGQPSLRLQSRLNKAVELYQAKRFPMILVSGGFGKEGYDEATVMRDYLVTHGVPEANILLDSDGVTTYASAKNTRAIADAHHFQSVYVITQYFHVPRSRLALERFHFQEIYSAHAEGFELRDIYSSVRECFGYLSYRFRKVE
ncbi:MAG: YdcF family protein [Luteolibacter sp.]